MKLNNKFIIVVPTYNAEDLIEQCLASIVSQNFDDLGVIIRNDMSTDRTDDVIRKFFQLEHDESEFNFNGKDIIYINNDKKLYPIGNTYESVINHVERKDAIIGVVDGDDSLISSSAVSKIFKVYQEEDKWLVWSQHKNSNGTTGQSNPLPSDEVIESSRSYWAVSHFRTSRAELFHRLKKDDLMDPWVEGSYFTFAGDAAFLFPFCEMCGNEKSHFLNESLYLYNNNLPTNEHNKSINDAIKYGNYIRNNMSKYSKLRMVNL